MRQCSCHDGSIQQAGYFLNDGIVRHTDADLLTVTEYLGQAGGAVQNEGESSGQITLHQLEGAVVNFGVFADLAQVVADDVMSLRRQMRSMARSFSPWQPMAYMVSVG